MEIDIDKSQKYAFKMKLNFGKVEEYKKRHDEIWPDLLKLLKESGIYDYSIFFDEETHILFGVLWRKNNHEMDSLPEKKLMKKWWDFMGDIMETNDDKSPKSKDLPSVFHMI